MIIEFDPSDILEIRSKLHDTFIEVIEKFVESKTVIIQAGTRAFELLSCFPSFYPDKEYPSLNISFVTAYIHPLYGKEQTYNIIIEIDKPTNTVYLIELKPTK